MPKPLPSQRARQEYCRNVHALGSFGSAQRLIAKLRGIRPDHDMDLYEGLSVAILILYFAPFKRRGPFRLPEDMVPPEYSRHHKELETHRDKAVAHRDVNLEDASWGNPNDAGFIKEQDGLTPRTYLSLLTIEHANAMDRAMDAMVRALKREIAWFYQAHVSDDLPEGHYVVSIDENPPEVYRPVSI